MLDSLRNRCWFGHRWTKWSAPQQGTATYFGIKTIPVMLQARCCKRCHKTEVRSLTG